MTAAITALLYVLIGFFGADIMPDCPTEDSSYCYWDASQHGNGKGQSFVNIGTITIEL